VSGAIPAVLLDAGYPLGALKGVPLLARTAGLIAHLLEEQLRPIGFVMSHDRPRLAQAYILRTADKRLIAIHLSSIEKFWEGLIKALASQDLTRDERFGTRLARIANYEALNEELAKRFGQHELVDLVKRLGENDVPFAPINTIDEVVHDPQVSHLG
jgi:crotonobetainyl-CoA:carnitine CoA-transferase CaiB-like acyl-CoA transferase